MQKTALGTGRVMRNVYYQIFLVMRLTTILLTCTMFQVYASGTAQTITFSGKNLPLKDVLKTVQQQTGYHVFYNQDLLKAASPVSITANRTPLNEFLELVLKQQQLSFEIKENVIVLTRKPESLLPVTTADILAAQAVPDDIRGKVVDSAGNPLPGIYISIKGTKHTAVTDDNGEFKLKDAAPGAVLELNAVNIERQEVKLDGKKTLLLVAKIKTQVLQDFSVNVNTGYQRLSKERATGSFEYLDSTVINRGVSSNILQRIEDMTPGLLTLRNRSASNANEASFAIRGRSTIFSNVEPLIVVDNYPFEGDLASINPNDVESVTVLKDAAATSIWGARGGNGVLVITLKKGKLNQAPAVTYNASFSTSRKENLYDVPQLSSSEFIDVQLFLYSKGFYPYTAPAPGDIVSPVVAILNRQRQGAITAIEAQSAINDLRKNDIRDDITKYIQQNPFSQQHSLSVSGGGPQNRYYLSAGYDQNKTSDRGAVSDRKSISFSENFSFLNQRLQANAKVMFAETGSRTPNYTLPNEVIYPYTRLVDEEGKPVAIPYKYSKTQISNLAGGKLIDMTHVPLDEFNYGRIKGQVQDYSISTDLSYTFFTPLKLLVSYQYGHGIRQSDNIKDVEAFDTRELINRYTTYDAATGNVTLNFPYGGMNTITHSRYVNHNGRAQLTFNRRFGGVHDLSVLAGTEIRHTNTQTSTERLLGYNKELGTNTPYNATTIYQTIFNGARLALPVLPLNSDITNRYLSVFANAAYTFKNRYIISGSIRRDESNLYGVDANEKGVPLWSAGLAWLVNQEAFYKVSWLPVLKLRITNGSSGNTSTSASGQTIVQAGALAGNYGLGDYYRLVNPANPSLRWERVDQLNIGVDFALVKNIVSGSFEVFRKHGKDLIGSNTVAPQVGVTRFAGNFSDLETKGFDLSIRTNQIMKRNFSWSSRFIVSKATDKITKLNVKQYPQSSVTNNSNIPREGYAYSAIFAFRYAGLNTLGQPMLLKNGIPTTDIVSVVNSGDEADIAYIGTFNARLSGSITNDFTYKNLSLSFIIAYRLGHYFKRNHLNYTNLYNSNVYKVPDFDQRWRQPGDEKYTNVPAMIYPASNAAQAAYSTSDAVLERADNFRLQDIRISYSLTKAKNNFLPVKSVDLYFYMSNMGIIWKATSYNVDPQSPFSPKPPRMYSFGLRTNL